MKTDGRRLGDIGENVACVFLTKRGFEILDRNYLKKWGELDIVAKKGSLVHFVEVKSVSAPNQLVSLETSNAYRAEDNMHPWKLKRLHRAIQTYLMEKRIDADWQLDLVVVKIDEVSRTAKAEILENII